MLLGIAIWLDGVSMTGFVIRPSFLSIFAVALVSVVQITPAYAYDQTELAQFYKDSASKDIEESKPWLESAVAAYNRGDIIAACDAAAWAVYYTEKSVSTLYKMNAITSLSDENYRIANGLLSRAETVNTTTKAVKVELCTAKPVHNSDDQAKLAKFNDGVELTIAAFADAATMYAKGEWTNACAQYQIGITKLRESVVFGTAVQADLLAQNKSSDALDKSVNTLKNAESGAFNNQKVACRRDLLAIPAGSNIPTSDLDILDAIDARSSVRAKLADRVNALNNRDKYADACALYPEFLAEARFVIDQLGSLERKYPNGRLPAILEGQLQNFDDQVEMEANVCKAAKSKP